MAQKRTPRRRKAPAKVKFELTRGSISGIAVVTFCLFLWMFLIGVWTGQSILSPHPAVQGFATKNIKQQKPPFIKAVEKKRLVLKKKG